MAMAKVVSSTGSCSTSRFVARSYTVTVGHSPPTAIRGPIPAPASRSATVHTAPGAATRHVGTPVRPSSTMTALLVPAKAQ